LGNANLLFSVDEKGVRGPKGGVILSPRRGGGEERRGGELSLARGFQSAVEVRGGVISIKKRGTVLFIVSICVH